MSAPEILDCQGCGPLIPELRFRQMTNGRHHLGAYCPKCGKWIRWLKQSPADRLAALQEHDAKLGDLADAIEKDTRR